MQAQPVIARGSSKGATSKHSTAERSRSAPSTASTSARAEIQCYIAIRDLLLAKVEENATPENIRSARIANEVVESCLGEVRLPYEAQYLNESDSTRERKNCAAARERLAALEQGALPCS